MPEGLELVLIPCTLAKVEVPREEKQPQSMILPPPCFAMAEVSKVTDTSAKKNIAVRVDLVIKHICSNEKVKKCRL